jgi:hypothetical protein
MPEESTLIRLVSQFNDYFKALLPIGGILYVMGFLVVAIQLSQYNLSPYGLLQAQYILAGLWLIIPFFAVYMLILLVYGVFGITPKPQPAPKKATWWQKLINAPKRKFIQWLPYIIIYAIIIFLFIYFNSTFSIIGEISYGGYVLIFITALLPLTIYFAWKASSGSPFRLCLIIFILLYPFIYIKFFAVNIYPHIPAELGGGKPIYVKIHLKDDDQSKQISKIAGKNDAVALSNPLKLLLVTDKAYFVEAPKNFGDHIAIEVLNNIVYFVEYGKSENQFK